MNETRQRTSSPTTSTTSTANGRGASRPRACIVRQVDRIEVPLVRDIETLVGAGYDVDLVVLRITNEHHWPTSHRVSTW
jgi:hypothetical protein